MTSEHYSFLLYEEENSDTLYLFSTLHSVYTVYFNRSDYDSFLKKFKTLSERAFAFGFFSQKLLQSNTASEKSIKHTIQAILDDFFMRKGAKTVLIFHYDTVDHRQEIRHKLFSKWYRAQSESQLFLSVFEVNTRSTKYYIGFLTLKANPNLKRILHEFELLALGLIRGDKPFNTSP